MVRAQALLESLVKKNIFHSFFYIFHSFGFCLKFWASNVFTRLFFKQFYLLNCFYELAQINFVFRLGTEYRQICSISGQFRDNLVYFIFYGFMIRRPCTADPCRAAPFRSVSRGPNFLYALLWLIQLYLIIQAEQ